MRGKKDKPTLWSKGEKGEQRKTIDKALLDLINPVKPIGITPDRKRRKKKTGRVRRWRASAAVRRFGSSGLR